MGNGMCVETSGSWTVFDWLDKILGNIGSYGGVMKMRNNDDFADRLSHHFTPMLLLIFTIIVSTKQYAGDPIQCWCPAQFTEAHVEYANQVCWISNTYYIPMGNTIPRLIKKREDAQLTYYQWVPYILLSMALMFKLPRILWKGVSSANGISIDKVVNLIFQLQLAPKKDRNEKLEDLTEYIETWLKSNRHYRKSFLLNFKERVSRYTCFVCGRRYGNFFMTASMITKIIYLINSIVQYYVLNAFLGTDFATWGFDLIAGLMEENPENVKLAPPRFPRVTLCDFEIRQMQNVQRWTIQCALPINLFNSRIFLFLWFWMLFVAICSMISLIMSFFAIMFPVKRIQYVKKFLILKNFSFKNSDSENRMLRRFVMMFLKFDGVYVLRTCARSGNDIFVAEIIKKLYMNYKKEMSDDRKDHSDPDIV